MNIMLVIVAVLAFPAAAYADACGAIICLGGLLAGGSGGGACIEQVAPYFAIQVWSMIGFNPWATAAARRMFLLTCPAGGAVSAAIDAITSAYGPWLSSPGF